MWQPARPVFGRHFCTWLLAAALLGAAANASAGTSNGRQVHVVYQGQRLGSIAKRYNVSIESICQVNGITRRDPIRPGQRLEIPSRAEAREMEKGAASPAVIASVDTPVPAPKPIAREEAPSKAGASKVSETKAPTAAKTQTPSKVAAAKTPAKVTVAEPSAKVTVAEPSTKVPLSQTSPRFAATAFDPATLGLTQAGVSHRVKAGESLSAIAVRYDTNVKTLLQVNNLSRDKVIRVGQVLVIPRAAATGTWWSKFARAPKRAGEIEVFAHHAHSIRWKGKVVANGKVQPSARAALSRMLGATGSAPPVPERLLQLLSHVSDTFGGRPIRLVSGYRTSSYVKDSRHRHSSAVDFSIEGVPNSAVRDYLLQLGSVGVGYYPNSTFVHLDVRARSAYWVDYAGPGEAPRKSPRDTRFASNSRSGKRKSTPLTRYRRITGVRASQFAAPELAERSTLVEADQPGATLTASDSLVIANAIDGSDAPAPATAPGASTSGPRGTTSTPTAAGASSSAPSTPPGPKPVVSDSAASTGT
jgi:LysM repeat protein